ncbi:YesL family protein [Metabacillus arenae]|uniref:YesL family protein n=1 Tax=Metabacillus arenae TaxID=2771434 RepID=A0A926NS52_9BACI|nr:YesL family protein [Metabacillus arenae]MBD1382881.1 YesL family protein [Metabacillus arenae]
MATDSKFYNRLDFMTNFFILNVIWLIMCIPVITIFPATAAMFSVIRRWVLHKDGGAVRPFFHYFKENLKPGLLFGLIWGSLFALFYADYMLIVQMESLQIILLPLLLLIVSLFLFTTMFLFPVMTHYQTSWKGIIRNSFLLSIAYFPTTLLAILILGLALSLLYLWPVTFLFIFSVCAYCIFRLCYRVFLKVEEKKEKEAA